MFLSWRLVVVSVSLEIGLWSAFGQDLMLEFRLSMEVLN